MNDISKLFPNKDKKKLLFIRKNKFKLRLYMIFLSALFIMFFIESRFNAVFINSVITYIFKHLPRTISGLGLYYSLFVIPLVSVVLMWFRKFQLFSDHLKSKDMLHWYTPPIFRSQYRINETIDSINLIKKEYIESKKLSDSLHLVIQHKLYLFIGLAHLGVFSLIGSNYSIFSSINIPTKASITLGLFAFIYYLNSAPRKKYKNKKKELENDVDINEKKLEALIHSFKKELPETPFLDTESTVFSNKDGFILAYKNDQYEGISRELSFQHLLCIAPTGTGKTQSIIMPTLLKIKDESLLVNDESGELFKKFSSKSQFSSFNSLQLNPTCPDSSIYWNPLSDIKSYDDAARISTNIIHSNNAQTAESKFWNDQAILLLTVVLVFFMELNAKTKEGSITFDRVKSFLSQSRDVIKVDLESVGNKKLMENFMIGYGGSDDRVAASVLNTVTTAIQLYSKETMEKITSKSTFSFSQLRDENTLLFLTTPLADRDEYKPYLTLFK